MSEPSLSEIHIFPIKSARGLRVDEGALEPRGLRWDRRWMVVGDDDAFVTQRELPRLSLLHVTPPSQRASDEAAELKLAAPGMPRLALPFAAFDGASRTRVRVWQDHVEAEVAPHDVNRWLSELLGTSVRLVRFPKETFRQVDRTYARQGDEVGFADGFPLLLISQASLDALNAKLPAPIAMTRFRTNLVVSGCEPFAEDRWRRIQIGSIVCEVLKPCARCVVTTVDERTGLHGKEPLKTLATFRKFGNRILFGQNVIHRGLGTLRVGDPVKILEEGPPNC